MQELRWAKVSTTLNLIILVVIDVHLSCVLSINDNFMLQINVMKRVVSYLKVILFT